jgi:hypothetical protein
MCEGRCQARRVRDKVDQLRDDGSAGLDSEEEELDKPVAGWLEGGWVGRDFDDGSYTPVGAPNASGPAPWPGRSVAHMNDKVPKPPPSPRLPLPSHTAAFC